MRFSRVVMVGLCMLPLYGTPVFALVQRPVQTHKYTSEELKDLKAQSEKGDAEAQEKLGSLYAEGYSLDQDNAQAVKWWRKSAEQGNANAQYELGMAYHDGVGGLPKSDQLALKWFRKAAEQDEERAEFNMGIAYYHGIGVKKDAKEAMRWFEMAAKNDNADAQYILAAAYNDGIGETKDPVKAYVWLAQARRNGNTEAARDLPGVEEKLSFDDLQKAKAILGDLVDATDAAKKQ